MSALLKPQQESLLRDEKNFLVDLHASLARLKDAPDELDDLRRAIVQLDELFLIVVIGEFNAGKSALVNALLGQRVLEEGVTPTTTRITLVKYGDRIQNDVGADDIATLAFPLELLRELNIVDTPGTNAVIRKHEELTRDFVPRSDLVLFVTSADRPFTESERQFLEHIREWGKKIVFVINKRDILDNEPQGLKQVVGFVTDHARTLLGGAPEIFAVSAKLAQAGDGKTSGMDALRDYVWSRLDETARLKIKFENPLGVADLVLRRADERTKIDKEKSLADLDTVGKIEQDIAAFDREVRSELSPRLAEIDNVILRLLARGLDFFDTKVRLFNILQLARGDRFRNEFEKHVLTGVTDEIKKNIKSVATWLVEKNQWHWRQVTTFLQRRRFELSDDLVGDVQTPYDMQRHTLVDGVTDAAEAVVKTYDAEEQSRRLGVTVEGSVLVTGVVESIAVFVGALGAVAYLSRPTDPLGLVFGGILAVGGLFVIPFSRSRVKAVFKDRVEQVRANLNELLSSQFTSESNRLLNLMKEGVAPYTRFVRSEKERLDQSERVIEDSIGNLRALQARVEQVFGQ
jgi:small GTP-binding protein